MCSAQKAFKWNMNVQEIAIDGVRYEYDTVVFWGTHNDTISFIYGNHYLNFYNVTPRSWKKYEDILRDKVKYHIDVINSDKQPLAQNSAYIRQDQYNELYLIRFVRSPKGVMIMATNIVFGVPNYTFIYTIACKTCID